ncbi:NAD(P)/FAD-dependent oxidoreductase [Bermanella sp. R86510]|uniref:NAD(P)/FAD-dependent oxidoreductase n=1 Tax=unclassified Bermanella TaxID=2627862 RepID=UPI0037C7BCFD
MERIDALIIGAGAIGLACARYLSEHLDNVIVIDRHAHIGEETSSRNSEVIHAGIYYPPNSLKSKLCIAGKETLYKHCARFRVPHKKVGKLIVAFNESETDALRRIENNAINSGVHDLVWLDNAEFKQKEPNLNANAALFSPSTGIIDSHAYLASLQMLLEKNHGYFVGKTSFIDAQWKDDAWQVTLQNPNGSTEQLVTSWLINAAGLGAQTCANNIDILDKRLIPSLHLCRGHYFTYSGVAPFNHLIYPIPQANHTGLGIHSTLDLAGQVRFGPDTEYIDELNYDLGPELKEGFLRAIKRYWPEVDSQRLQPGYSGIRPKLSGPGEDPHDFVIQTPRDHGCPQLINLFGIESPGLTASLAIGEYVLGHVLKN